MLVLAWVSSGGSLAIQGKTGETGSVNVTLGEHEGTVPGTVHFKGSWNCAHRRGTRADSLIGPPRRLEGVARR